MSVLIDSTLKKRFMEIFPSGGDVSKIRAAKYYLTLGEELLFLPDGETSLPGMKRRTPFTLQPGQSAAISTKERVSMPHDLMGIIGSRFENSARGLLFFGGMIVDPGYGHRVNHSTGDIVGEPLLITVANVGDRPIELRPGEDAIASLAFLKLERPVPKSRLDDYKIAKPARDLEDELGEGSTSWRHARPLAFVEELEKMELEVDKVRASTDRVVLFGVIVLSVTLCAAVISALFSVDGHLKTKEPFGCSVALTLGVVFVAVGLLTASFYGWIEMVARKQKLSRTTNLRGS
jgi:deoxycytidine triphosphate deaminase